MMQGDACYLGIQILNNAHSPVTPQDLTDLEITIGPYRKTYCANQLLFESNLWFFPLTQQETLAIWPAPAKAQVRLHWKGGVVEGKYLPAIPIFESLSKEVI